MQLAIEDISAEIRVRESFQYLVPRGSIVEQMWSWRVLH